MLATAPRTRLVNYMTTQEDAELFDMQDYPNVHAAGIADLYCLNDGRGRLVFFDWFKVDGLWIKKVVGTVTRPCKSMVQEQPMVVDKLMQIAQVCKRRQTKE